MHRWTASGAIRARLTQNRGVSLDSAVTSAQSALYELNHASRLASSMISSTVPTLPRPVASSARASCTSRTSSARRRSATRRRRISNSSSCSSVDRRSVASTTSEKTAMTLFLHRKGQHAHPYKHCTPAIVDGGYETTPNKDVSWQKNTPPTANRRAMKRPQPPNTPHGRKSRRYC